MNILILNTAEFGIAPNRLLKALLKNHVSAKMLVRDQSTGDGNTASINASPIKRIMNRMRFYWERLVIFLCNKGNRENLFRVSIANTGTDISRHPLVKEADIIHLHWINQGFLSLRDIKKLIQTGKPIVWTMHDMWPCTGICHYAWECEGFMETCGKCPMLLSKRKKDLSYRTLKRKQFLSQSTVRIVAVSSWLKQMASRSAITGKLEISVIPNVIDMSVFSPSDQQTMRRAYSLPQGKKIIIMGAAKINDPIKGFQYLQQALSLLKKKRDDLFLVLFGEVKNDPSFFSAIPVEYAFMGVLSDPSMIARLYASADVTVVPSFYETFGQTLIESMACGCPVVSFNNSGQTDIINHKENGYLASYGDVEDLARGIEWVLENKEKRLLSEACLKKVEASYSEQIIAGKYIRLYTHLLEKENDS